MEVADVLGVVVAGNDQCLQLGREERLEEVLGGAELAGVALGGEVSADDDEVGVEGDGLLHRGLEKIAVEVRRSAVQVGKLCDHERVAGHYRESTAQ